jgi:hypothetical protein
MPETAYENCLHAEKISSYQKGKDELMCDGERDFQRVHQESEFIWTRINLLLKGTRKSIENDDPNGATRLIEQAGALWSNLTAKVEELLWRLWPNDFRVAAMETMRVSLTRNIER